MAKKLLSIGDAGCAQGGKAFSRDELGLRVAQEADADLE